MAAVFTAVVAAGCGSEERDDAAPRQPAGEQETAEPRRSADEQEAAEVATRYFHAVAAKDWEAACATRTGRERKHLARLAGSCDRAMEKVFAGKPVDLFEDVEAGDIRIEGDLAGVDMHQPGQEQPAATVAAIRENGRWVLADVPDSKIP